MDILTIHPMGGGKYKVHGFKHGGGEVGVELAIEWPSLFGSMTKRKALSDARAMIEMAALPWLKWEGRHWFIETAALLAAFPDLAKHRWLSGILRIEPEREETVRESFGELQHQERVVAYLTGDVVRELSMFTPITGPGIPPEISESLAKFKQDYPDPMKTAFIMMRFGNTPVHHAITQAIRDGLEPFGIKAVRADDRHYNDDLFPNVLTYLHGCGLAVAVYERLESDDFNPNVSLEVGYMMAFRKPLCLLKDKTLKSLNTDLVGKLYRPFDPQNADADIKKQLAAWVKDKQLAP